jgi:hypothetical protein
MSWRAVDVRNSSAKPIRRREPFGFGRALNLRAFYYTIESSTEERGRSAFDSQLLISLWIYAYSQGIGSALPRGCSSDSSDPWAVLFASTKLKKPEFLGRLTRINRCATMPFRDPSGGYRQLENR